jgi:hypothetical protein
MSSLLICIRMMANLLSALCRFDLYQTIEELHYRSRHAEYEQYHVRSSIKEDDCGRRQQEGTRGSKTELPIIL